MLSRLWALLLDLLYPRRAVCMGCGELLGLDRDELCEACRRELALNWIGATQPPRGLRLDGAAHAHVYTGPARGMVINLKYGSVWLLAEQMGEDIARAARELGMGTSFLVTCVPMHPKRLRRRGRNHAELLARSAAAKLGAEYRELLVRTRNAPQQARLNREERLRNLKGGFAVPEAERAALRGATVLLIDDVCTTGATARYCAATLRAAGARHICLATYALSKPKTRENARS